MQKLIEQKGSKNMMASLSKAGLLLVSALTLAMTVGCNGGTETETPAEPTATENVTPEPAPEPEVAVEEPVVETEQPEAEVEATQEAATSEAAAAPLTATSGAELYEAKCKSCHEKGLLKAPVFGNKEEWAPRIAKGKETLYKHSAEGFNSMPPQAVDGVSVEQIHAAVDYMIEKSS